MRYEVGVNVYMYLKTCSSDGFIRLSNNIIITSRFLLAISSQIYKPKSLFFQLNNTLSTSGFPRTFFEILDRLWFYTINL